MGLERQRPVVLLASRPEPSPRESQFRRLVVAKAGGPERRATLAAMPAPSLTGGCLSGGVRFGSLSRRGSQATATVPAASVAPERLRRHRRGSMVAPSRCCRGKSSSRLGAIPMAVSRSAFATNARHPSSAVTPRNPTQMSVRMGAFDGDPGVRPGWRAYFAYAACWEAIPDDGLERFAEGKPRFKGLGTSSAPHQAEAWVPPFRVADTTARSPLTPDHGCCIRQTS